MGNYRFRLSDMMPNAWFYKLKEMNKPKTQNTPKKRLTSSSTTTSTLHQKHQQQQQPFHQYSQSRNSCYYTPRVDHFYINSPTITTTKNLPKPPSNNTHFPPPLDPPRKSSKRSRTKRKTIYKPSPKHNTTLNSAAWTHHQHQTESARSQFQEDHDFFHSPNSTASTSPHDQPHHHDDHDSPSTESTRSLNGHSTSRSSSCSCRVSSSATDIIIDMNNGDYQKPHSKKVDHPNFDHGVDLPPILTKPPSKPSPQSRKSQPKLDDHDRDNNNTSTTTTTKSTTQNSRRSVSYSTGMKLRSNSPRIEVISKKVNNVGGRKSSSSQRKSFSRSMAIVKSSCDPQKDFRESMVEMIVENNIRASQDLEELLACYLTLNSDEYHDLIVKAFEQIWFNLPPTPS